MWILWCDPVFVSIFNNNKINNDNNISNKLLFISVGVSPCQRNNGGVNRYVLTHKVVPPALVMLAINYSMGEIA